MDIVQIDKSYIDKKVTICGWIKNHRKQANFGFIALGDGTCLNNLQVVYDNNLDNFDEITKLKIGSSIEVEGIIKESLGAGQDIELSLTSYKLLGDCPDDYPLQPKRHTNEFLRSIAYLRPRGNLYNAVFRIRSVSAMAIHTYFNNNNYVYVHSPIITTADCEGSDQMFKISTFDFDNLPLDDNKNVDTTKDLFGKQAYITGTGQLHGETFAHAYKKIYTFGPTFRTEHSNTKTHANEFWMIEPEICFCDLNELMNIEEDMLKFIVKYTMDHAMDELIFLDKFVSKGLLDKLNKLLTSEFIKISHKEVVDLLLNTNQKWEFTPGYEEDIAKEHEKFLTEHFNNPVFITNWPKDIKSFYMKVNDDNKTVAAVDLIVPGAGELMGGSQREERYDVLLSRMKDCDISREEVEWYLNLRKYGTTVHAGFGMGFERLVMYLTGVENIRDVIPYPRTPGSCEF
ncbi:MAG: asparagine--tRNA ligase [bacterium]